MVSTLPCFVVLLAGVWGFVCPVPDRNGSWVLAQPDESCHAACAKENLICDATSECFMDEIITTATADALAARFGYNCSRYVEASFTIPAFSPNPEGTLCHVDHFDGSGLHSICEYAADAVDLRNGSCNHALGCANFTRRACYCVHSPCPHATLPCVECPDGTVLNAPANNTCNFCFRGKYKSSPTQCSNCPARHESPVASSSPEACSVCPPGRFSGRRPDGVFCHNCTTGRYQSQADQTFCRTCPSGRTVAPTRDRCIGPPTPAPTPNCENRLGSYWCGTFRSAGASESLLHRLSRSNSEWRLGDKPTCVREGGWSTSCTVGTNKRYFCAGGSRIGYGSQQASAVIKASTNNDVHPECGVWTTVDNRVGLRPTGCAGPNYVWGTLASAQAAQNSQGYANLVLRFRSITSSVTGYDHNYWYVCQPSGPTGWVSNNLWGVGASNSLPYLKNISFAA